MRRLDPKTATFQCALLALLDGGAMTQPQIGAATRRVSRHTVSAALVSLLRRGLVEELVRAPGETAARWRSTPRCDHYVSKRHWCEACSARDFDAQAFAAEGDAA